MVASVSVTRTDNKDRKPMNRTATARPQKVRRESPVEVFLVTDHWGKELTVIVTTDLAEALRQAREEEVVREAVRRDGGIWIYPLRD